ncbi:hypothetical protein KDW67_34415 [Burkholderia cenocepacia]|uniref:hypothetical protein n=1 Tax=Burkholderia cenocepacia TaxID=95486 RepID=UPI00097CA619|nr:hypothetical protein [Burkholderia cenocepacia]AQQ46739.1 hypothetical protein A8F32_13105 [Burkholderia cenocepacia]MBR8265069.1 hypothetical protein [Burkholderia cenocepacia]ONI97075.1 hypothetical protein A8F33_33220 [Burkholderia cenocepacia]ONJ01599.1 hypothetical protein A8F53_16445 [Burkholderia cenocepacia]ONJ33924.1 hypothetical protein A8F38_07380 [Burkholderia cenocepacia]
MSEYQFPTTHEPLRTHVEEPGVTYETPADVLRALSAHLTALDVDVKRARSIAGLYREMLKETAE